MKLTAVLTFTIFAVCITSACGQSHNITWGNAQYNDQLLAREIVVEKYQFWSVVKRDFKFPLPGTTNYKKITGIKVADQYVNDNGGYATLLAGGPGYEYATIHLKSKRHHGFNFIIEIYGR